MTYRCEYVRCGKCKGGCAHGPYWYAYWKVNGFLHKRYIGKIDPRPPRPAVAHAHDAIFSRRTATVEIALQIIGLSGHRSAIPRLDVLKKLYRRLVSELHPDHGGEERAFARTAAAYSYLKAFCH